MSDPDTSTLYSYSFERKLLFYALSLLMSLVTCVFLANFLLALVVSLRRITLGEGVIPLNILVGSLLAALFFSIFPITSSNAYPNIELSNRGITVQVFIFWSVFVPWEEVVDIRRPAMAPFSRSRIVVVERLTPYHLALGLGSALIFKPAFQISPLIEGFHEAVGTIEEKVGKPRHSI